MNHEQRRAKGRTVNNAPTLTDQSAASETDLNIIVTKFGLSGTLPGNAAQPMSGDFTGLPTDLRGFIETARQVEHLKQQLPAPLRNLPAQDILNMTPQRYRELFPPPAPTPAPPPAPTPAPKQDNTQT